MGFEPKQTKMTYFMLKSDTFHACNSVSLDFLA